MTFAYASSFAGNRLLDALPAEEQRRLQPLVHVTKLGLRDNLFRFGDAIEYVYFPLSGMISLVVTTQDGSGLEIGVVGQEGMVPVDVFLGGQRAPYEALVQGEGQAVRMEAAEFRRYSHDSGPLRALLERYTMAKLAQARQAAVCNGLHPVEERLARWILLAHDRGQGDVLPLTQEFLGLMLGVRRASVTTTEAILQDAGLIRIQYGRIEVLDRAGLEDASCECYAAMRLATDAVFSRTPTD